MDACARVVRATAGIARAAAGPCRRRAGFAVAAQPLAPHPTSADALAAA